MTEEKTMRLDRILAAMMPAVLLAGCATSAVSPSATMAPPVAEAGPLSVALATSDGRTVDVTVVERATPKGVLIVSHGGGNSPAGMKPVLDRLADAGFAVLAPLHTDSQDMPAARRTDLFGAFPTRVADLNAVSAYAAKTYPGMPIGTFGYSYGSLIALVGAGALQPMASGQVEGLDAVVMFSSPGPLAGVTDAPGAFADVNEPTLFITGTADVVPGFVPDPKAHLVYFDGLPTGDHTALVVDGATHGFLRGIEPGMDEVAPLVLDFLHSRMLGDRAAAARFDAARSTARVDIRRR